jgi:ABC-type nitrate/sulfonate/bicarbonate transport system permease component
MSTATGFARLLESTRGSRQQFVNTPVGRWTVRVVTLALLLTAWEIGAANVSRALTAPPSEIFQALIRQAFVEGTLWGPFLDSLTVLILGLAASLAIGIPVGLAMGRWKTVAYALDPYVTFLYALPHVALVPLMIILLGFGFPFRFGYVVLSAVWPVIISTMVGVRQVDKDLIDAATAYSANGRQIMRGVILPAASPYIVAGGRQAFSAAWSGVIVSEITTTLAGLGGLIKIFSIEYLTADMFVPIFAIMIVATAIQGFTAWAQQRLTPWQQTRLN